MRPAIPRNPVQSTSFPFPPLGQSVFSAPLTFKIHLLPRAIIDILIPSSQQYTMGAPSTPMPAEPTVTFSSGRDVNSSPPDIRLLHYNDVYHLDPSSAEPAGGVARFITVCKEYREAERFKGQPNLVTLFSGDVFNPSLESSITKGQSVNSFTHHRLHPRFRFRSADTQTTGRHMVPLLNLIGTDCACVGVCCR